MILVEVLLKILVLGGFVLFFTMWTLQIISPTQKLQNVNFYNKHILWLPKGKKTMLDFEEFHIFQTQKRFDSGTQLILSRVPMFHYTLIQIEDIFLFS